MEKFQTMLNLQLQLFVLIGIGYLAARFKMITKPVRGSLTNLFINFILPCNIFCAFSAEFSFNIVYNGILIILITLFSQIFSLFLSKNLYNRKKIEQKKVYQYGTLCSNCGFMGNPIIQGVYGNEGLIYGSIAMIPLRLFMWSFGLTIFTTTGRKRIVKQLLTHPCIIAVLLGIFRMLTGINLPVFLDKTVLSISDCVTTLSMLIIGSILYEVNFKEVFCKDVFYYSFVRLLFIPGVELIVLQLFHIDKLLIGVSVLLAGMPAASLTAILAEKYGGDVILASKCVFVSTVLSVITLPLFCLNL